MRILLNDDEFSLERGETLVALLEQLAMRDAERIAIAVNDRVVRRGDWPDHRLNDNDRVLLIAPIQGG
ncbi:MAG: sulfur carrier protein ThiS [Gammaproteobacteria bacterium]|nr:sulfur carrier protein ThiS [Gammaproteobacteria bacterium]